MNLDAVNAVMISRQKVRNRIDINNLEKAKKIVKAYYGVADCGIFNSRNIIGDMMKTIYEGKGLTIDVCYDYLYFEVFGLSDAEFRELEMYYYSLDRKRGKE